MADSKVVATVLSAALIGFDGQIIEVETDSKAGLPSLTIVGMGNKSIDEARQRVRSAIANSLLSFPAKKLTTNLAPAELPKDGTHLDLPIALSILVASGQLKQSDVSRYVFAGELALDGHLRPVRGVSIISEVANKTGARGIFVPIQNLAQARLTSKVAVTGVTSLKELFLHLSGVKKITTTSDTADPPHQKPIYPSIDDIIGNEKAKRALLIAAAGKHNLLLSGPPGTGKTMLASVLAGLLPALSNEESVEVTKIHSLQSNANDGVVRYPVLRSPHHNITLTALIGGGLKPIPGEISLAHNGVLFLDELPEYSRSALEALRQPLENGTISLSRLYGKINYPADFILVATMNPCPCGFFGDTKKDCSCTQTQINNYQKRLSGPLLDRIDLKIVVNRVESNNLLNNKALYNNQQLKMKELVVKARTIQNTRYNSSVLYNCDINLRNALILFNIDPGAIDFLKSALDRLSLSARSSLRVLRVARTIADIENSKELKTEHVAEALQYR